MANNPVVIAGAHRTSIGGFQGQPAGLPAPLPDAPARRTAMLDHAPHRPGDGATAVAIASL